EPGRPPLLSAHRSGRGGQDRAAARRGARPARSEEVEAIHMTDAAKKRILAVDDDPLAVSALRQILTQRGYDVTTTTSGEEAVAVLADQNFDLAILDVTMPGMSGYDLCRMIRKDERTRDLPVIFLTAKALL